MRKPYGSAVLKTLPAERQEALIAKISERGMTYKKVRKWLADDGLETSETSIGDFWQWWHLRQRWASATDAAQTVESLLKDADPSLSPEQIEAYGQAVFLKEAIAAGGSEGLKGFVSLSKLRLAQKTFEAEKAGFAAKFEQKDREIAQKDDALRLQHARFQRETCELFIKWQNDERAKNIAGSGATNAEKIEQLGQAMFGEDWTA